MSTIKSQQHQLLAAIFNCRVKGEFDARGLSIYRQNLRATAAQALKITFSTVHQLIGEELFQKVSDQLLQWDPPQSGNWASWGVSLAGIIEQMQALREYPFIADCARLDYTCHQLIRSADSYTNLESLNLMQIQSLANLKLLLNPSLTLIDSQYPIAQIRSAHQLAGIDRHKALRAASELMRYHNHFQIACFRDGHQVRVIPISTTEYHWLKLLQGNSLEQALEEIDNDDFDFQQWLLSSVETNLLNEVTLIVHQ